MRTKWLLVSLISLLAFSSCVFEAPFVTEAKHPVNPALLGRWEEIPREANQAVNQLLVLPYTANEYVVSFPLGKEVMTFRAFGVELEGETYVQIQLLGTADGQAKPEDRKFHLLKVKTAGDALEIRTIRPELLGGGLKDSAQMRAAFAKHQDDPALFDQPIRFRRRTAAPGC